MSQVNWNEDLLKKAKFVFTGGVTAIGGILQLKLLVSLGWSENVAYVAQLITMLELNFVLSNWLTWRGVPGNLRDKWVWFHIGRAITIAGSMALNPILTLALPDWFVYFLLIALAFGINYVFGDKIVFKQPTAGCNTQTQITSSISIGQQ